ncbi:hypothetical protein VTN02DRAFT_6444 [Thermoascus thermophilus]
MASGDSGRRESGNKIFFATPTWDDRDPSAGGTSIGADGRECAKRLWTEPRMPPTPLFGRRSAWISRRRTAGPVLAGESGLRLSTGGVTRWLVSLPGRRRPSTIDDSCRGAHGLRELPTAWKALELLHRLLASQPLSRNVQTPGVDCGATTAGMVKWPRGSE